MGKGRDILYGIGVTATAPVWGVSLLRTGKWRTDWAGRLGRVKLPPAEGQASGGTVLIHAVSVGEASLIRGLVDELTRRGSELPGGLRIVIASTTNTGFARATALYGERHPVIRYPFDFSAAVAGVLDAVRPEVFVTVELEVWPNMVEACERRGVPVVVVNGRLSERSYRGYRRIKKFIGPTFAKLSAVAAQTEAYAERFVGMGVPAERVAVLDTMKWDTAVIEPPETVAGRDELAAEMGIDRSRRLIVAGSTSPGEEKLLIDTCPAEVQLLIAPRKPEWFDAVARAAPDALRRTSGKAAPAGKGQRVFLLDTIGELRRAYSLADVCIVGRSFMGDLYGSDMMEPIALGKPTIIGPHHTDFADTMKALTAADGIVVTDDPGGEAARLLSDPERARQVAERGRAVIRSRQGATVRHAELILDILACSMREN